MMPRLLLFTCALLFSSVLCFGTLRFASVCCGLVRSGVVCYGLVRSNLFCLMLERGMAVRGNGMVVRGVAWHGMANAIRLLR